MEHDCHKFSSFEALLDCFRQVDVLFGKLIASNRYYYGSLMSTGETFTDGKVKYTLTPMNVTERVMSLALSPVFKDSGTQFSKVLNRFQREDPTFCVDNVGSSDITWINSVKIDSNAKRTPNTRSFT